MVEPLKIDCPICGGLLTNLFFNYKDYYCRNCWKNDGIYYSTDLPEIWIFRGQTYSPEQMDRISKLKTFL
jgi:hypothetical protein